MDALPWLVVHGASVWRIALGLLVFGAAMAAFRRPRARAARAARLACADLGWPVDLDRARPLSRVTLAGELDLAAEPAALRTAHGAVRLEGTMTVLAGSHEEWPGGKAESRSLSSGDRVRVTGLLREEAADEATTYREARKRYTLGGGLAAAFEGAPRVSGPEAPAMLLASSAGAAVFLLVFGVGGRVAMDAASRDLAYRAPGARLPLSVELASASPFTRRQALGALVRTLDARQEEQLATLETRASLHALLGEPVDVAAMWIDQGEPSKGADLAARAHDTRLAARGYYAAGDFARAADAWGEPSDEPERDLRFGVGVNVLAGSYTRAARISRKLALVLQRSTHTSEVLDYWNLRRADAALCLESALDALARSDAARSSLRRAAPTHRACALLYLDALQGTERERALAALPWDKLANEPYGVPMTWLALLGLEAGPGWRAGTPFDSAAELFVVPNGGALSRALPAIERGLAERFARAPDASREAVASTSASASAFAFLAGDVEAARRLGRAAEDRSLRGDVAAAVALPADAGAADLVLAGPPPVEERARRAWTSRHAFLHGLRDFVVEHNATELVRLLTASPPPDERERQAWFLAAGGDGLGLVEWLRGPTSQPGTFLRYGAPLLKTGRAAVASWVRHGYRPVVAFRPVEEVVHLATLTDAAEALEDAEGAAALRERTRRFREALLRRETSVILGVLDRL